MHFSVGLFMMSSYDIFYKFPPLGLPVSCRRRRRSSFCHNFPSFTSMFLALSYALYCLLLQVEVFTWL